MEAELRKIEEQISQLREFRSQMIQKVESRYISANKAEEFEIALNEITGAIQAFEALHIKIFNRVQLKNVNSKMNNDSSNVPSPAQLKLELQNSQQRVEYAKIRYYDSLHGDQAPDTWLGIIKRFFKDLAVPQK